MTPSPIKKNRKGQPESASIRNALGKTGSPSKQDSVRMKLALILQTDKSIDSKDSVLRSQSLSEQAVSDLVTPDNKMYLSDVSSASYSHKINSQSLATIFDENEPNTIKSTSTIQLPNDSQTAVQIGFFKGIDLLQQIMFTLRKVSHKGNFDEGIWNTLTAFDEKCNHEDSNQYLKKSPNVETIISESVRFKVNYLKVS